MLKTHKAVILEHIELYYPSYMDSIQHDFEMSKFKPRFRIGFDTEHNCVQIWEPTRRKWENIHNFYSKATYERFMLIQEKHIKKMKYNKDFAELIK